MFRLARSKDDIKREILCHFTVLLPMLAVPILMLLINVINDSSITMMNVTGLLDLKLGKLLVFLTAPFIMSFSLLGLQYTRYPKYYTSRKYTLVPGLKDVSDYIDALVLYIIMNIFIVLWMFLFVIPGIVKMFSYSQAFLIYFDEKHAGHSISYLGAITASRQVMHGYKLNYFLFSLSFIGWYLLSGIIISIGVGILSYAVSLPFMMAAIMSIFAGLIAFGGCLLYIFTTIYEKFAKASYFVALCQTNIVF